MFDLIPAGFFTHGDRAQFYPFVDNLLHHDPYLVLADFDAYSVCQQAVGRAWLDPVPWTRISILNVARSGEFSSDRRIDDYLQNIWHVPHVPIELQSPTAWQARLAQ